MEQPDGLTPKNDFFYLLEGARARRALSGCQDIFGDPAFEILLALRLHQDGGVERIGDVIEAVDLPEENFIRWLTVLENAGLVERDVKSIRLTARSHSILDATINR
jgi:DNA-binding transcriptional ArsR family regulator